jgi:pyridoxine kinase
MKQVLSVQDLSCLGKCSLTVALPVLSAMGCAATALPTTLLSTHTAFPAPHRRSLTEDLMPICRHWQSIGASFDTVSVGYLADAAQVQAVEQEKFLKLQQAVSVVQMFRLLKAQWI